MTTVNFKRDWEKPHVKWSRILNTWVCFYRSKLTKGNTPQLAYTAACHAWIKDL